tara:strand:+ start:755 stop:952 length:198 start_codon:yes stop_codon:yes gene_type:complete
MSIDNEIFAQYRENQKNAMMDRLELHETFKDGMFEIWMDPETMTKYKVEVVRDFKKMKEVGGKSI